MDPKEPNDKWRVRNQHRNRGATAIDYARPGRIRERPDWDAVDAYLLKTFLRTVDAGGGFTGYGRSSDGGCFRVTAIIGSRSASIYEHRSDKLAERMGDLIEYILRYGRVW